MLDIQLLRSDLAAVAKRLADRGFTLDAAAFEALEAERKKVQTDTQELQAKRNALSKQIGQMKAKKEDASALMAEVNAQAEQLKALEQQLADVQQRLNEYLMVIPNLPQASVPFGKSADDNPEVRRVGEPRQFDFTVKDHVDAGAALGGLDFSILGSGYNSAASANSLRNIPLSPGAAVNGVVLDLDGSQKGPSAKLGSALTAKGWSVVRLDLRATGALAVRGDLIGAAAGERVGERAVLAEPHLVDRPAVRAQLLGEADQRDHDLGPRIEALGLEDVRGAHDGARLHRVAPEPRRPHARGYS